MNPEERANKALTGWAMGAANDLLSKRDVTAEIMARLEGVLAEAIRAAETDARREALYDAAQIGEHWAAQYPVDVFPPESQSLDAKAAGHGRHVASCIARDIRALASQKGADK